VAVPDFQSLMRPVLMVLDNGTERSIKSIRADLAEHFDLTPQELEERIPSGRAKTFQNRIGWATTYPGSTDVIVGFCPVWKEG